MTRTTTTKIQMREVGKITCFLPWFVLQLLACLFVCWFFCDMRIPFSCVLGEAKKNKQQEARAKRTICGCAVCLLTNVTFTGFHIRVSLTYVMLQLRRALSLLATPYYGSSPQHWTKSLKIVMVRAKQQQKASIQLLCLHQRFFLLLVERTYSGFSRCFSAVLLFCCLR